MCEVLLCAFNLEKEKKKKEGKINYVHGKVAEFVPVHRTNR